MIENGALPAAVQECDPLINAGLTATHCCHKYYR